MVDSGTPTRTSTWKQFIESHADQILAIDFTTQFLWNFDTRYVFVVMALGTREIVQVAVTASPTLALVKQQIRDATAWGRTPRSVLHDNDGIFGQFGKRRVSEVGSPGRRYRCALDVWFHGVLGIEGIPIPYGAPNAAAHIERFMGTLRRECLRHFIFLSDEHMRNTLVEFVNYYKGRSWCFTSLCV